MALAAIWCVFIRCDHGMTLPPTHLRHYYLVFSTPSSSAVPSIAHSHYTSTETDNDGPEIAGEKIASIADSSLSFGRHESLTAPFAEVQEVAPPRKLLRGSQDSERRQSSSYAFDNATTQSTSSSRRKLPGYADQLGGPAAGGIVLIVIVLLILLCCCRGSLCDLLACVCLYEICCDDGAIGGFNLM